MPFDFAASKGFFFILIFITILYFRVVDIAGPDGGDFLSIVRLSRVLRPLRAINRVPSKFLFSPYFLTFNLNL